MLTVEIGRPLGRDAVDNEKAREASVPCPRRRICGPNFGWRMRRRGRGADTIWVWISVLGRLFCPRQPKQTATDEMGRPIGVVLSLYLS